MYDDEYYDDEDTYRDNNSFNAEYDDNCDKEVYDDEDFNDEDLMKPFMTTLPMMTKILMKMMNITKTMRNTTKTIIIEIITKDLEGGRHLCLLLDPTMCFKNRSYYSILSVAF